MRDVQINVVQSQPLKTGVDCLGDVDDATIHFGHHIELLSRHAASFDGDAQLWLGAIHWSHTVSTHMIEAVAKETDDECPCLPSAPSRCRYPSAIAFFTDSTSSRSID